MRRGRIWWLLRSFCGPGETGPDIRRRTLDNPSVTTLLLFDMVAPYPDALSLPHERLAMFKLILFIMFCFLTFGMWTDPIATAPFAIGAAFLVSFYLLVTFLRPSGEGPIKPNAMPSWTCLRCSRLGIEFTQIVNSKLSQLLLQGK